MVIMGLNTSLRISDILGLRWKDVYNFKTHQYKEHLIITEQKTGKNSSIALNDAIIAALLMSIYNHSSYEITKRYLGISQDERDRVFLELSL